MKSKDENLERRSSLRDGRSMGRSVILPPECKRRFALRAALNQGSRFRAVSPETADRVGRWLT